MTRTGHTLDDVPARVSYRALDSFIANLGIDSKLASEVAPEFAEWSTRTKTNALLADIFDMLAMINANLIGIGTRKKAKEPKKYPRPKKQKELKRYGSGALPATELREWIRRKQNG